ncbi:MAG: tRNA lysidine(34) synthetase TilS [Ruminococcus sp.]|nr:tRNA lysidine(34) synthetase TilS [Ruminococcus sp.]
MFRTRESGDFFTFYKRNITKPLRKALNEQGVPKELRDTRLLLCDGSEVLWCEALGFSKRGKELNVIINIR